MSLGLKEQIEDIEASAQELRTHQRKAERVANAVRPAAAYKRGYAYVKQSSRLTELGSEDFEHMISKMKANTTALK